MKKKIIYLCLSIVLVFMTIIVLDTKSHEVLINSKTNNGSNKNMISMMLETSANSGEYQVSNTKNWPGEEYSFNKELSKCENGGELTWDDTNKKVILTTNISDKCYVYFDIIPDISVAVTNLPKTVGPLAQLNCSGATSIYNQQYNRIEISQVNSKSASCNLNYAIRTTITYLNNKIIGLSGTTQGTGKIVNENGYRYEGQDPNNYIWFNNEMWRIIGVFGSESHGVANTNLVKIIKESPIGGIVWDKSKTNDWSSSSLKALLNTEYLNSQNGTNGNNCYGYSTSAKTKCDYTDTGIKDKYRNFIKEVTWYLGGFSTINGDTNNYSTTVNNYYIFERGSKVYSGRPTSLNAKIGLMYISDYGYAVQSKDCSRSKILFNYDNNCILNDWLSGKSTEYSLNVISSSADGLLCINNYGDIATTTSNESSLVRPVLYLDSSVYVFDGNGSWDDPYIIAM